MLCGFFVLFITLLYVTNQVSARSASDTIEKPIKYPGPIQTINNRYGTEEETSVTVPDACKGKTFCTIKPPDYPQEKFDSIFKGKKQAIQVTLVPENTFADRQGDPSESDGCDTEVSYEPLYQVRSRRDGDWRTVVQAPEENFVQKVRLEECKNEKSSCFQVAGDLGIETFCKQKYSVWEVLVSDGKGGTERIKAELPICCSCHYRI